MIRGWLYQTRFFWLPLCVVVLIAGVLMWATSGATGGAGYTAF